MLKNALILSNVIFFLPKKLTEFLRMSSGTENQIVISNVSFSKPKYINHVYGPWIIFRIPFSKLAITSTTSFKYSYYTVHACNSEYMGSLILCKQGYDKCVNMCDVENPLFDTFQFYHLYIIMVISCKILNV